MTILLLNQFFWPDAAPTGRLLTDLAEHLAEAGHDVTVVCSSSTYAAPESAPAPPVTILRSPSCRFTHGPVARALAYLTFLFAAFWHSFRVQRPDLVVTLTTPPLLSCLGSLIKLFRRSRHFIWEMDLYPDVAEDLGYLKRGSRLARLTGWFADASRRSSNGVVALGECMRTRLIERGIPAEKIFVADNWADSRAIEPVGFPATQPLTVLYSGNLGLAHDASTIAGVIDRLQASSAVKFRFSGGGTRQVWLRRQCTAHRWSGVEFSDYKSTDAFAASLGGAHIGLVTQLAECCGSVVPSKIYSIMAAGRPILFIGPKNSTAARIIRTFGCGWHVDNGQTDDVACLLEFLSRNPELVRLTGERAHQAFLARFDRPIGLSRLCAILGATADASAYRVERDPLPGLLET